jgi:hypothetical protein
MIDPLYSKVYLLLQVGFSTIAVLWAIHGETKQVIVNLVTVIFLEWAKRIDRRLEGLL